MQRSCGHARTSTGRLDRLDREQASLLLKIYSCVPESFQEERACVQASFRPSLPDSTSQPSASCMYCKTERPKVRSLFRTCSNCSNPQLWGSFLSCLVMISPVLFCQYFSTSLPSSLPTSIHRIPHEWRCLLNTMNKKLKK